MASSTTIAAGTKLGPYTVGEVLGTGASATVYLAQDEEGRQVAVKARRSGVEGQDRRFLREFESMRLLRVPGVVQVYEAGIEDTWLWFSMERVHGGGFLESLHKEDYLIERVGRTIDQSIQLLDTLAELHGDGFVHRDIKPSNVLVDPGGAVHVLDFGIGRYFDDTGTLSHSGEVIGTVPYMAPEQLAALPLDCKVDLFATGLMIYEAIAGKRERPFTTVGWIPKICMERLQPLAILYREVPLGLSKVVERLLAADPRARPTASEAADALREVRKGVTTCEWPEPVFVDPGPWLGTMERCLEGEAPVVVLEGPSGSGRKRAAEQIHRTGLLQGRWTVHLHCRPDVIGAPLVELLEVLIAALDDKELAWVIGEDAVAVRQLWPHLLIPVATRGDVPRSSGGLGRAIADIVRRLSETRLMLLVFHDVERLDSFTARALPDVAAHAGEELCLLLIHESRWKTARSSAVLHALMAAGSTRRIAVNGVTGQGASSIVASLCPGLVREFVGDTAPQEAVEVALRALAEQRAESFFDPPPTLWPLAVSQRPLPVAIYRRLVGRQAEHGPWVTHADGGITLNGETARALVRSRIASLSRSADRVARAWGATLGDRGNQGDLASIWLLSATGRLAWAPAARAAIEADRRGLYADARKWTLLLDAMPSPPGLKEEMIFDLACVRARVALRTDAVSARISLVDEAEKLIRNPEQEQRVATLRAEFDLRDGVVRPALVHALHVGSVEAGRAAIRARFIAVHCRLSLLQISDAKRELQRANAILKDNEFPILAAQGENWAAEIAFRSHDLQRCREYCLRAISISRANNYVRGRAFATARLGRVLRQLGNRREAERQTVEARDAFARTGDVYLDAGTGLDLATLQAERGEILGARHLLDQSIRRIRTLHLNHFLPSAMRLTLQLATARLDQTEASMALSALREQPTSDSETPSVLARWWRVRGDFDRAMAVEGPRPGTYGDAAWRLERARAALASGDREAARTEARTGDELARAAGFTELTTYAGLILGLLEQATAKKWHGVIRRATSSLWTEVYLAALEVDARRQSEAGNRDEATRKWHTLHARAAELGYRPAVEEAEGWLSSGPE